MNEHELNKILRDNKIGGGFFDRGNMIFDPEFYVPTDKEAESALAWVRNELSWWVYSTKADCNAYHIMELGRMREHSLKSGSGNLPWACGVQFGSLNGISHMWAYIITDTGLYHTNYGQVIVPEKFKSKGSITA